MSNKPRIEEPGFTYHVSANAADGLPLYRDDDDRIMRFELFAEEAKASQWTILEWSYMTTHEHILLVLEKPTLSSGFRRLQSRYARAYNRRHGRRGVVWQRRFHAQIVESDRHLFEAIRYLALNAPRAGLADTAEDWAWCSYGSAIGARWPDPLVDEDALLGLFSRDKAKARRMLRDFVEEKDPRERWRLTRVGRASDAKK